MVPKVKLDDLERTYFPGGPPESLSQWLEQQKMNELTSPSRAKERPPERRVYTEQDALRIMEEDRDKVSTHPIRTSLA